MQVSNTGSVSNAKNTPFDKYRKSGSYHWAVLSHNPFARNLIHLGRYQVTQSLLESAVYGVAGKSVLDMGCGDGVLSYRITRAGGLVSGIDLCEYAIEYAKKQAILRRVHIDFSIQDVCATKFPDGTFDAVVSNEVIEHLSEPGKMLLEIKRVLRPGGIAVLSTPIRVTKKPLDPYHVNEWFREDFCDLVELVFPDVEYRVSQSNSAYRRMVSHEIGEKGIADYLSFLESDVLRIFHGAISSTVRDSTEFTILMRRT